jgi:sec-independent protein translocase protein TatB
LLHSDESWQARRLTPVFNLQGSEIVVILLLALVVLGPEKLPDAIRRFSKTYAELKKMGSGFQSELKSALDEPMREMRETSDLIRRAADPSMQSVPTNDPPVVEDFPDLDPDVDGVADDLPDLDPDVDGVADDLPDLDPDVDGVVDDFPDPGSDTVARPGAAPGETPPASETAPTSEAAPTSETAPTSVRKPDHDERQPNGTFPGRTPAVSTGSASTEGSSPGDAADPDDESATA